MDPVELYRRTSDEWLARVRAVKPDAWDAPSPCTDWNARDVVNQLAEVDDPLDACFSCGFGKIARYSKVAFSTYLPALLAVDKIIRH